MCYTKFEVKCYENSKSAFRWILLLFVNAVPFAFNVFFYQTGSMDDLFLFLPVYIALTTLNAHVCNKTQHYVLIQTFTLVCIIASNIISTNLYYQMISDDPMTPVVGKLFLYLEAGILLISTAIIAMMKAKR